MANVSCHTAVFLTAFTFLLTSALVILSDLFLSSVLSFCSFLFCSVLYCCACLVCSY